MRELSPRPVDQGTYVAPLPPPVHYSRWRAGPLTFGPLGRVGITVVVVLVGLGTVMGGFNPGVLWFLSGYMVAASLILKHTWTRVRVPDAEIESQGRATRASRARHPVLFRRVNPWVLLGTLGPLALAAVFAATRHLGAGKLFLPIAALITLGIGLVLAWLSGV